METAKKEFMLKNAEEYLQSFYGFESCYIYEEDDGTWIIKRHGILNPNIQILGTLHTLSREGIKEFIASMGMWNRDWAE